METGYHFLLWAGKLQGRAATGRRRDLGAWLALVTNQLNKDCRGGGIGTPAFRWSGWNYEMLMLRGFSSVAATRRLRAAVRPRMHYRAALVMAESGIPKR